MRLAESGSGSLTPPRSTGGALGGLLGLRFAPAADGQQQGRLTPIGFCLGGFSRSRAEALRRRRLLRQAAFQSCHKVNDCWRRGHFPGFDREPLHLGFNQLAQGLLVAVSIHRQIETSGPLSDDRARDRDHLGVEIPLDATELGARLKHAPSGDGTEGLQTRRWREPDTAISETGAHPIAKSRRQKICLAMLVRNEAPVIARCLASVRPLIDQWVVVDTGSTDGTPDIVRNALCDVPGELHQRPWVDFGHNRTEALRLAQQHGDYTLMIDAGEVLELPPGFRMPHLNADSYVIENGEQERQWRPRLVRNGLAWRHEGVLHEFLSCGTEPEGGRVMPHERSQKRLPGARIRTGKIGAGPRNWGSGHYRQEADLLERALATETDPFLVARYKFYLAQTHVDAGDKEEALAAYRERAALGFWDQEVFISLYRSAGIEADLGFDEDAVIASYLLAHEAGKDRAEALHGAARFCRLKERYQQGFDLAKRGILIKRPDKAFFREDWIYQYGLLDEYAINAYWIGRYDECLKSCRKILGTVTLSDADRKRIQANADFARQKLSGG